MRIFFLSVAVTVFLVASIHAEEALPSVATKETAYEPNHLDGRLVSTSDILDVPESISRQKKLTTHIIREVKSLAATCYALATYNLRIRLLTGEPEEGHGVAVFIKDEKGKVLLDDDAPTPLYIVNLNPGTYQIEAEYADATKDSIKTQTVTLDAIGSKEIVFRWDD